MIFAEIGEIVLLFLKIVVVLIMINLVITEMLNLIDYFGGNFNVDNEPEQKSNGKQ